MNQNFIFVFILLITLSIVNAAPFQHDKKGIQFKKCEGYPKDAEPDLLTVTVTPDPIEPGKEETFDISITLKNYNITDGTFLDIGYVDDDTKEGLGFFSLDICSKTKCPIEVGSKAGSPYSTTQKFAAPTKLPSKYTISVLQFLNAPDIGIPYSCAVASIGS
ncbi:hypothetical protein C1645_819779 [Glomus cerebriforme]|uniref:Phosphatidylglycerol/phosphatidylinositol transfer protein n=1 Tax=Glomus cerebriforme TaxID=658196 RepID=A0A397T4D2_9GLOM|nr:hypothetical protein C1645_819779 [Glomus cerebriforme]